MKTLFTAAAFLLAASSVAFADSASSVTATGAAMAGGMIYGSRPTFPPPSTQNSAGGWTPANLCPPVLRHRHGDHGGYGNGGYGGIPGAVALPTSIPTSAPWTQPVY